MKLAFFGILFSISSVSQAAPDPQAAPSINVSFGKPTFSHQLTYLKMYSEKPFEQAVLYYYDNGLYKIISPGEDHYGVYVVEGDITDEHYSISYMSLPSSDWSGNIARHDLTFHRDSLKFEQKALAQVDQNIGLQHGTFTLGTHQIENPASVSWQNGF